MDLQNEAMRKFAGEIRLMYLEFQDAGFDKEQAFELTKEYIHSAGFVSCQQIFNSLQRESSRKSRAVIMQRFNESISERGKEDAD